MRLDNRKVRYIYIYSRVNRQNVRTGEKKIKYNFFKIK